MPPKGISIFFLLPFIQTAPITNSAAVVYLERFGYIQPAKLVAEGADAEDDDPATILTDAIKRFQDSAGLAVTGELDGATRKRMTAPRCGVVEFAALRTDDGDDKWFKQDLTYTLNTRGAGMSESETRNAIKASFDVFSAVIPLKFREVEADGDINIRFDAGEHEGCDGEDAFDGKGQVLAHAAFPEEGVLHFDEDEQWTVMNTSNMPVDTHNDFLTVALHELGHALGLYHVENDATSIMAPYYIEPKDDDGVYVAPKLDKAVVKTLQHLYGAEGTPVDNGGNGLGTNNNCLKLIYAAVTLPNYRFMLFNDKGTRATVFNARTRRATQSGPISEFFSGGPRAVFSAYFNKHKSYMMMFHRNQVWRYNFVKYQFKLADGYPKTLPGDSEWHIEGAWHSRNETVVVGDAERPVGHYNDERNSIEMKGTLSEVYPNLPEAVAGFAEINGREYGFTQDYVFTYKWDTNAYKKISSIAEFLHC